MDYESDYTMFSLRQRKAVVDELAAAKAEIERLKGHYRAAQLRIKQADDEIVRLHGIRIDSTPQQLDGADIHEWKRLAEIRYEHIQLHYHNTKPFDRAFRFLAGLQLTDQPVTVQREYLSVVHEMRKALKPGGK